MIAAKLEQISTEQPAMGKEYAKRDLFQEEDETSIITSDLKEYQQDRCRLRSLGEILELHQLHRQPAGAASGYEELCQSRAYDFMRLMVTAILEESTELSSSSSGGICEEAEAGPQGIITSCDVQENR